MDTKPKSAPAKPSLGADGHPTDSRITPETKQYAAAVKAFVKAQTNPMTMADVGIKVARPKGSAKIGELLKHYPHWFVRSGAKGTLLFLAVCAPVFIMKYNIFCIL